MRKRNYNKAIIVVGNSANVLFKRMEDKWPGVWYLNKKMSMHLFEKSIAEILNFKIINSYSVKSMVSKRQWQVLILLSQGFNMSKISNIMGISEKTTSLHKISGMNRLGFSRKLHHALVINAIRNQYAPLK